MTDHMKDMTIFFEDKNMHPVPASIGFRTS